MDVSSPAKRGGDVPDQPRSKKRAKYTLRACNECKRRKLKCSGESVCSRCVRDGTECIYANGNLTPAPEGDFKDDRLNTRFKTVDYQIETLQREMRTLSERMHELESNSHTNSNSTMSTTKDGPTLNSSSAPLSTHIGLHRIMNAPKSPSYVGPTSAEFGITARQKPPDDSDDEDLQSSSTRSAGASEATGLTDDPLRSLGQTEALRLVGVYENTVGIMYPCVDLDSVRAYIIDFYRNDGCDVPASPSKTETEQDWFIARDVEFLKILLATALLAESHGRSERAAQLADSVEDQFASRLKVAQVDMKELLILTLLSIFHSYRDDEVIAWRLTGMAVRGAMELGLHCQDTWTKTNGVFPGELQWTWASRLFWCIYVLDRKWSFGTGLPFAIQDSDMDTNLPQPGTATPYLTCMISYARLSTKIWELVVGWRNRPRSSITDNCAYLDFQVQQWIQSIPSELRFDPTWRSTSGSDETDNMTMLQVLLALQANQLRILVYRQYLLTTESIDGDVSGASIAVETAKSTVHMLDYYSRVSNIYFQRPEPFNYFLISALAALFLAVLHAPTRFSTVCRPEFYAAVDMVRRSSTRARTSRRLQKIIKSLKLIQLNLGMSKSTRSGDRRRDKNIGPAQNQESNTPLSSTTHSHTPLQTPGIPTPQPSAGSLWSVSSPNTVPPGDSSCEDLTSFFEMAGGFYFDPRAVTSMPDGNGQGNGEILEPDVAGLDAFHAEDEALTRVMAGLM
ncbi:hypothetical protein ASPWEDRAFT_169895 [Aspergillus wentii DTO 134E9]|uniref:Zn(2)-C6 fungal-type domain-containing protein n=1 Tax=Aspergillus wentii DTO 134E9 TaxID=1073089 RepID=A0A1L9RNF2_ASPWE|nr:uncharacterized protein ASPWEDRAFT_169895 [Aspergillus wentii DTO 134E9]KAI9926027.1 hypothetical protein MW887_004486 [Aspergillus wentii]OJJ36368.1 hypothetical protein ASPWEDRAFT_169895 [Aspergillus wentii DTO 134E9]